MASSKRTAPAPDPAEPNVQALESFVAGDVGPHYMVRKGDLFPASDRVVRNHPDKFGEPRVRRSEDGMPRVRSDRFETATAAPGEVRGVA